MLLPFQWALYLRIHEGNFEMCFGTVRDVGLPALGDSDLVRGHLKD